MVESVYRAFAVNKGNTIIKKKKGVHAMISLDQVKMLDTFSISPPRDMKLYSRVSVTNNINRPQQWAPRGILLTSEN